MNGAPAVVPREGNPSLDEARLAGLLSMFAWLDSLLRNAVSAAKTAFGPEAAVDSFRGLYLEHAQVEDVLARAAVTTPFDARPDAVPCPWLDLVQQLTWATTLRTRLDLSPFDLQVLAIALAPEFDLRYERVYAFLQDDVSRKRPSVDLVLNLLCPTAAAKLQRRAHFLSDGPLVRHGLIQLVADPNQMSLPLLAHMIKVDDTVVRLTLGHAGLDSRLAPFCTLRDPDGGGDGQVLSPETRESLCRLLGEKRGAHQPLVLQFVGPAGSGQEAAAELLAASAGMKFLTVDLARGVASRGEFERVVPVLFRDALQQDALVFCDGVELLSDGAQASLLSAFSQSLRVFRGTCVLSGTVPLPASSGITPEGLRVSFRIPDYSQRRACWRVRLLEQGITCREGELDVLAARYRLSFGQISSAVAMAQSASRRGETEVGSPEDLASPLGELCAAARQQTAPEPAGLARKIEPRATWNDLVLPTGAITLLRELCDQAMFRQVVYEEWGFGRRLSLGKGLVALFCGPPGTGKTLAAEVVANELALDLLKIDLSQLVSKYIGETEKNLDRVFAMAERANAILLFDEADTLFGQRSQVRDAHDRYANIEVGYLLQRMEEYDGVAILATNLAGNMDGAFVRRLTFRIEFPFPEDAYRERIWRQMFTPGTPLGPDLDFRFLANRFRLAGGNIKNVVLGASFLAAAEQQSVGMTHLVRGLYREFQKMGKTCAASDFGEYSELLSHARR